MVFIKKWFDHNLNLVNNIISVQTNQDDPRQRSSFSTLSSYMEMLSARYSNRELYWINQYRLIRQYIWTNNRTWNVTNYLQNKFNRLGTDHRLILRKGKNETIYTIDV
ncbi:unnamed protein product, partial [Rotaria sordida]